MKHQEITEQIIQAFYTVYNNLGYGFLEKVYEKAMFHELKDAGLKVSTQQKTTVYYKDYVVGEYVADMIVNDVVLCELKSYEALSPINEYQLLNYLRATSLEVGLLLNFGKKPQVKRKIFDNEYKQWNQN
jgi:hypothetical protein